MAKTLVREREREQGELDLAMEYPEEGERITAKLYAFRLWAADAREVALSIDGGPWRACRPQVGHWWYHWEPSEGRHSWKARMKSKDGRWTSTGPRTFRVEPEEEELEDLF